MVSFYSAVLGEGRIPISCHSQPCNSWLSWWYNKGTNQTNRALLPNVRPHPHAHFIDVLHSIVQGYGCPGLSLTASAICIAEVARVDASCSTFILVHSSLAMSTIGKSSIRSWLRKQLCTTKLSVTVFFSFLSVALCGSEAQKQKYLPSLSQFKTVGCWVSYIVQFIFNHLLLYCQHHHSSLQYCGCYLIFHLPERTVSFLQALTEPDYGSDASSLRTAATKVYFIWKHDFFS